MIRLALIEDNLTYQMALKAFLETVPYIDLVYVCQDLGSMPALIACAPHVVIMDLDLGKESGIDGIKMIKAALPQTEALVLTVFEDEAKIVAAIRAGAAGYLLKKDPPHKIAEAVRSIYNGEGAVSGQVARKVLEQLARPPQAPSLEGYNLTRREKEILLLLIEGLSYKEIAARLYVSIDTINSHIRKIYSKLNIHTRSEIAARLR